MLNMSVHLTTQHFLYSGYLLSISTEIYYQQRWLYINQKTCIKILTEDPNWKQPRIQEQRNG